MISCRLKGGLGNFMFQIAAIESLGKKFNLPVGYYNVDEILDWLNTETAFNPELNHAYDYLKIFKNFNWPKASQPRNKTVVPFHFTDIIAKDDTTYDGYFQSEKFFYDRNFILTLFEPSAFIEKEMEKYKDYLKGNTCSIHVRRGDYLKISTHHVSDKQYFENAMGLVKADNYLVFSDDMQWCKSVFLGNQYYFIENEKDYVEVFLQSRCKHNIISSSTFSWWGAYLNKNQDKKVIAPKVWFMDNKYDSSDVVPENWIKI
jgi:hypothetical protein